MSDFTVLRMELFAVDRPTPVYADYENAVERWSVGEGVTGSRQRSAD